VQVRLAAALAHVLVAGVDLAVLRGVASTVVEHREDLLRRQREADRAVDGQADGQARQP